ncbi:GABBR [Mytilus edulis]|uniref:GABBR n=1 Tax=Mytilus edulis TaxID=6550 RepID=A0A8S3PXN4_MYTED|nr:GABBR [Mytilus edulis]
MVTTNDKPVVVFKMVTTNDKPVVVFKMVTTNDKPVVVFKMVTTNDKPVVVFKMVTTNDKPVVVFKMVTTNDKPVVVFKMVTTNDKPVVVFKMVHVTTNDKPVVVFKMCDPGVATDALLDLIYRKPQILMVMGGACSEVTETLAELSPYWNLILAIDGLAKILEENKITIKRSVSFNTKETEISSKILELQRADIRVIIGGFSEVAARKVFCQAYKHGMFGSRFVWILIKETVERWWEASNDTECTVAELQLATEGYFIVTSLNTFNNNQMSVSNITADKFLTDYKSINGTVPLSPYATSAYDTVWTMALTIKETLRHWKENSSSHNISQFDYDDGEYIMADLRRVMQNLSFDGLSGPISFQGPDRRGISVVSQNQGGRMKTVAMYDPENRILNFNCSLCDNILWKGNRFPRDKVLFIIRQRGINDHAFYAIVCVSLTGIISSVCFLRFNYHYRKLRYIKLSSPKLNNLAVFGCILVYSGILLLGLDDNRLQQKNYPVFCTPSPEDPDILYIYQSSSCQSVHMDKWLGSFYAFKGFLLIFGVYMAWETRNVKIPALNDSQYIGMNVYNVVTMTITVVVMSNILSKSPTLSYIIESTILLVSTTVTLCLLFVPKIYCIVMAKGAPVIASSGILVEDKTRRFIVNDKREIYYRAEVQNRVYKREIVELEQEITRLERLLEQPLEPYPKMTSDLMKVLPETRIDSLSPTQDITRRIRRRSIIVNGEEVSLDGFGSDSSDSSSSDSDTIASGTLVQPFANRRNPLRMSIKNAAASTARRLSLWRKAITEKHNREKPNANNLQQRNQLTLDIKNPKRTNIENDIRISDNLQVPSIVSYSHLDDMNPRQKWRIMLTPESESEDVIEITSISPDMSMETCIADDTESRIVRTNLLKGR